MFRIKANPESFTLALTLAAVLLISGQAIALEKKTTRVERTFDVYGNVTQIVEHGDIDRSGDERTVVRAFAPNTAAYIVSLPYTEAHYNGTVATSAELLAETEITYD